MQNELGESGCIASWERTCNELAVPTVLEDMVI